MIVKGNCKIKGSPDCPFLEKRTGRDPSKYYYRCMKMDRELKTVVNCELAGSSTLQQEEFLLKKIMDRKGEMTMAEKMKQTLIELQQKVSDLLEAEWDNVTEAYVNHDFSLSANIKIVLEGESTNVVQIQPILSFYPMPKTEIKADKFTVDEKQIKLFKDKQK